MADNREIINCPACKKSMAKIYIESANKYIDICLEGCGGIFFDNREFELFDEAHENADDILAFYDKLDSFKPIDDSQERICPTCNAIMTKIGNGIDDIFKIDCCYTCGAKFLDAYELQKIRTTYSSEEERKQLFEKNFSEMFDDELKNLNNNHENIKKDNSIIRQIIKSLVSNIK